MPLRMTALLFGEASDLAGTKAVSIVLPDNMCTLSDFLRALDAATGKKLAGRVIVTNTVGGFVIAPGYKIMLNKHIMNPQEAMDHVLKDSDELGILPPFSGG
ncbi:MAG: MoaD/ThiS family protein [Candidatus Sigynarchaeum springense]